VHIFYIAQHFSLAALEAVVHTHDVNLVAYRAIPVEYDPAWIETLEVLPEDWPVDPAPASTKTLATPGRNKA
jgi:ribulose-5-phosphate 4-epimerase/fuculose-1-phosphate aldolase